MDGTSPVPIVASLHRFHGASSGGRGPRAAVKQLHELVSLREYRVDAKAGPSSSTSRPTRRGALHWSENSERGSLPVSSPATSAGAPRANIERASLVAVSMGGGSGVGACDELLHAVSVEVRARDERYPRR